MKIIDNQARCDTITYDNLLPEEANRIYHLHHIAASLFRNFPRFHAAFSGYGTDGKQRVPGTIRTFIHRAEPGTPVRYPFADVLAVGKQL